MTKSWMWCAGGKAVSVHQAGQDDRDDRAPTHTASPVPVQRLSSSTDTAMMDSFFHLAFLSGLEIKE